jgi:hypothetical protein
MCLLITGPYTDTEKNTTAYIIGVTISTVPVGKDGFYALVIMASLYCNFLFLI